MEFEFDPDKSAANREKHGLDFATAQRLWLVSGAQKPLAFPGEVRHLRIALLGDRFWSAVFTLRGTKIRLISVRRARQDEVTEYERAARQETLDHPQSGR